MLPGAPRWKRSNASANLGIELDGEGHYGALQQIRDSERKIFLRYFGIKIIRFENKFVFEETAWIGDRIRSEFDWKSRPQE